MMSHAFRLAAALAFGVAAAPANAACYEVQGCTDSAYFSERFLMREGHCDVLWEIRNRIYKENGYCFRTPRGIAAFGNAGCRHDDINAVPLNQYERANVAAIARVERMKGCPR